MFLRRRVSRNKMYLPLKFNAQYEPNAFRRVLPHESHEISSHRVAMITFISIVIFLPKHITYILKNCDGDIRYKTIMNFWLSLWMREKCQILLWATHSYDCERLWYEHNLCKPPLVNVVVTHEFVTDRLQATTSNFSAASITSYLGLILSYFCMFPYKSQSLNKMHTRMNIDAFISRGLCTMKHYRHRTKAIDRF